MARKIRKLPAAPETEGEVQMPPPVSEVEQVQAPKYAFLNKQRCPRCNGTNTVAIKTEGPIQTRACRAPSCWDPKDPGRRLSWKVSGTLV
jgi:hypothetical protein